MGYRTNALPCLPPHSPREVNLKVVREVVWYELGVSSLVCNVGVPVVDREKLLGNLSLLWRICRK